MKKKLPLSKLKKSIDQARKIKVMKQKAWVHISNGKAFDIYLTKESADKWDFVLPGIRIEECTITWKESK